MAPDIELLDAAVNGGLQTNGHDIAPTSKRKRSLPSKARVEVEELVEVDDQIDFEQLRQLQAWNQEPPKTVETCAHALIYQHRLENPDAPAVCSWDGKLSYRELDTLSSSLATRLVQQGVGAEVFVPVYFEKSQWTIVAMLGIMKAGGAFVLLDVSHPIQRLKELCRDVKAKLVITSRQNETDAAGLATNVIVLDDASTSKWKDTHFASPVRAQLDHPIYAIFTSGTSGKPKGVVIEHRALSSSCIALAATFDVTASTRALQFASYAFDACILETLTILIMGGCVCIPSETERKNDLAGAASRFDVNWAFFTPALARIMEPKDFPTLKTLIVGGEVMTREIMAKWIPRVQLFNSYGPTETTIIIMSRRYDNMEPDPYNIGFTTSAVSNWIVDQHDHEKLVPIGDVGELLLSGPTVGRGYLGNPQKTAEVFIDPPEWLLRVQPGSGGRGFVYKTGDLVKYAPDGSVQYIGRKDTQAKLHGQRLELSEVEHHVRRHFPRAKDAVADVVPITETSRPALVAFVWQDSGPDLGDARQEDPLGVPGSTFHSDAAIALPGLQSALPSYMVPTIFFPLNYLPLAPSGKIDRRLLRNRISMLSNEQIEHFSPENTSKRLPGTETQRQLQKLFATVLQLPTAQIGLDDHFLRRGGDSVLAIKLVSSARDAGLSLTVADVFDYPRLVDLAERINPTTIDELDQHVLPFSLVKDHSVRENIISELVHEGGITRHQISDIYPCTPLQEGLISLTAKVQGKYIVNIEHYLREGIDIQRFKDAFDHTVAANPILRTRITISEQGSFQVVVQEKVPWDMYDGQEDYEARFQTPNVGAKQRLVYPGIVTPKTDSEPYRFILTLHHSLYDGWSLPLIFSQIESAYEGVALRPRPFSGFIDYLLQPSKVNEFWKARFAGLEAATFPSLPSSKYVPTPDKTLFSTVSAVSTSQSEHTVSTAILLAWALVLSYYTDCNDTVFGTTISGRKAPVAGIEGITGPTIATLPLRVQLNPDDTIQDTLSKIQNEVTLMIPYEQIGLQNLRKLNPETAAACDFQSHVAVQSPAVAAGESIFEPTETNQNHDYGAFASYAFLLVCHLGEKPEDPIKIAVNYDSAVVGPSEAQRMTEQFQHVLGCLMSDPGRSLRSIHPVSSQDMQELTEWNSNLPSSYDRCLHDMVLDYAITRPNAPAISACDGTLTFSELGAASSRLAAYLRLRGVRRGSLVPVCFEKSKWSVVSMIAILRAGAACVCIDPKHPKERIRQILDLAKPQIILTTEGQKHIFDDSGSDVITVPVSNEDVRNPSSFQILEPEMSATPQDPCFIIFTSGSTGRPKGIIMGHANLCTSIRDHSSGMNVNADTRALHFASYAFDASIYEIFSVLANGGCLCIPSEFDRMNNITGFIEEHKVNWALITPSVVQGLIQPEGVPNLRTLVVGGEAVTQEIVDTWASKLTLIIAYGPGEATICSADRIPEQGWITGDLGRIVGGIGWITLPSDPQRLAPIGAVGELVIEGPVVTHGYLDDPEKTASAYIPPPKWLTDFRYPANGGRLYKSGDLVQYTRDGSMRFVGRKDTQVKLRGQRIELAEVEYHVGKCFPDADEIAAEVVIPGEGGGSPMLVGFIVNATVDHDGVSSPTKDLFVPDDDTFTAQARCATTQLNALVPTYMVPAIFLQLSRFPRTGSGKIDRRKLREETSRLPLGRESAAAGAVKRRPETEKEELLLSIWSTILKVSPESIGIDDDFFHIGGHSISAMRLASAARERGLDISVFKIFQSPILTDLAKSVSEIASHDNEDDYVPGSMLGITDINSFASDIPELSAAVSGENIIDVLPCTDIQTMSIDSNYLFYHLINIPQGTDFDRLEQACCLLAQRHPLLRALYVRHQGALLQAILRDIQLESVRIDCGDEDVQTVADAVCSEDCAASVPLGGVYFKSFIFSGSGKDQMFVLRTNHTQLDGASLPLFIKDLSQAYEHGVIQSPPAPPFSRYLQYRLSQRPPSTYEFWREYLQGSQMTDIHAMIPPGSDDNAHEFCVKSTRTMAIPPIPERTSLPSVLRAAWALALARASGQRDVVFGHVSAGRDVPVSDVANISGPTIIMCPFRVTIQPSWTIQDLLSHAHDQYIRSIPFADVELKDIVPHVPDWAPETDFTSLYTHQNDGVDFPLILDGNRCQVKPRQFWTPPHFHFVTYEINGELNCSWTASSKHVSPALVDRLADGFEQALSHFAEGFDKTLRV
ncbi:NRPS [Arachnomyces sp. PD_36]|nr:NRPS [Arachnomyces sp. PD_36]